MKFPGYFFSLLVLAGLAAPVWAVDEYDLGNWMDDVKDTRWETGAVLAGVTGLGLSSWEWGSSKTFRWKHEGWFDADTYLGGSDKLGHAYTSYAVTNVLFEQLVKQGRSPERAVLSATLTSQAILTYMEVLDGFSAKYGFSPEDFVMNLLGSGFAYARAIRPEIRDLVDFRMEGEIPAYKGYQFRSNYLLALKLSGIDTLRDTPLRFLELQAGYYTRGYIRAEQADGYAPSRYVFVGVGLNMSELLLGRQSNRQPAPANSDRLFLEHVQVPGTATKSAREL